MVHDLFPFAVTISFLFAFCWSGFVIPTFGICQLPINVQQLIRICNPNVKGHGDLKFPIF